MSIACLLWDFGDTLCDERFIWGSGPAWLSYYQTFDDNEIVAAWNRGEIDTQQFAEHASPHLGLPAAQIISHMEKCCTNIEFYQYTMGTFRNAELPQAIVTVNPDIFSNVIAPAYELQQHCGTIVTSWEEGTEDKRILCALAIERLGLNCKNNQALLIDNRQDNIDAWVSERGSGYLYTADEQFQKDFRSGADGLLAAQKQSLSL